MRAGPVLGDRLAVDMVHRAWMLVGKAGGGDKGESHLHKCMISSGKKIKPKGQVGQGDRVGVGLSGQAVAHLSSG